MEVREIREKYPYLYETHLHTREGILNFRMSQKPLFLYPVNEKLRPLITGLVSEEHGKTDLISISLRRIKRRTEPVHPFFPWQRPIHTGIAIPCMIRNKNSPADECRLRCTQHADVRRRHCLSGAVSVGAGLCGTHPWQKRGLCTDERRSLV